MCARLCARLCAMSSYWSLKLLKLLRCSSCVAACLSLPLAAGSLLFSGIGPRLRLASCPGVSRVAAQQVRPESSLLELIEAASESDLDKGIGNPSGSHAECRGSQGGVVPWRTVAAASSLKRTAGALYAE